MKRMVWQLPAVIGGTAVLTFCGVSTLQAAMNAPLQEYGASVQSARASAAALPEAVGAAPAAPPSSDAAAPAAPAPAPTSAPTTVQPAAEPIDSACGGGPCGDPGSLVAAPAVLPDPVAPPAEAPWGASAAQRDEGQAAAGPGNGRGAGRDSAPGQNRDAAGMPAKSNGTPAGAGNQTSKGNQGSQGGLGPAMDATRQLARQLDQLLGLPEPPGLSGPQGNNSQGSNSQGNGRGQNSRNR